MKSFDQQVADWARTKPADEAYTYTNSCGCALHNFLTETGYPVRHVYAWHWEDLSGNVHWFDGGKMWGPLASALIDEPRTFGALADRLSA